MKWKNFQTRGGKAPENEESKYNTVSNRTQISIYIVVKCGCLNTMVWLVRIVRKLWWITCVWANNLNGLLFPGTLQHSK
jgi:hypothetical protein